MKKERRTENNCWICEKWTEYCFKIDMNKIGFYFKNIDMEKVEVKIHLEFDKFKGDNMEHLIKLNKGFKGIFRRYRMIP